MRIHPVLPVFVALGLSGVASALSPEGGGAPDVLGNTNFIRLSTNTCASSLTHTLTRHGFAVAPQTTTGKADAELLVTVINRTRDLGVQPNFGPPAFAEEVDYVAVLRGRDGKPLFRTGGRRLVMSEQHMCDLIGRDIVQRLGKRS